MEVYAYHIFWLFAKLGGIKNIVDPFNHSGWETLLIDKLECVGGNKIKNVQTD